MNDDLVIDVSFDIRSDAGGKDPDRYSATLRRYHQVLWGRPLPDGTQFTLVDTFPRGYLRHTSELGDFKLSSDMIIRTMRRVHRMKHVIDQVPARDQQEFSRRALTIGGTIVFPRNQINGKHTINQARGINRKIEDRFDLTLECIRRHYVGDASPLEDVLTRYGSFFSLFGDFRGYVRHFMLEDLVTEAGDAVRFFTEWHDFSTNPLPANLREYDEYRKRTLSFVDARNRRIEQAVARGI